MAKPSKPMNDKSVETAKEPSLALQLANRYLRWILLLVIAVVVFGAYVVFLGAEVQSVISTARENLPRKAKILSDLRVIKNDLDDVVHEFDLLHARKSEMLQRLDALLPTESRYGELFALVDEVTRSSGLLLRDINISFNAAPGAGQVPAGFTQVSGAAEVAAAKAGNVKAINLSINVEGGDYETFKKYLNTLERQLRLFDVKSISFDGGAFVVNEKGANGTPRYEIEFLTYYQPSTK